MDIRICGIVGFSLNRCLARFRLRIKQAPDPADPVAADAVEARGQDVDQETPNELIRGQVPDLHAVPTLDAIIFPAERTVSVLIKRWFEIAIRCV